MNIFQYKAERRERICGKNIRGDEVIGRLDERGDYNPDVSGLSSALFCSLKMNPVYFYRAIIGNVTLSEMGNV